MPFENTMLRAPATAAAQGLRSIAFGKLTDTAAPLLSYVQGALPGAGGGSSGPGAGLAGAASSMLGRNSAGQGGLGSLAQAAGSALGSGSGGGVAGLLGGASQGGVGNLAQAAGNVLGAGGGAGSLFGSGGAGQALGAVAGLAESGGSPLAGLQQLATAKAGVMAQDAMQSAGIGTGMPNLGSLQQLAAGALPSVPQFSSIPTAPALSRLGGLGQAIVGKAGMAQGALSSLGGMGQGALGSMGQGVLNQVASQAGQKMQSAIGSATQALSLPKG